MVSKLTRRTLVSAGVGVAALGVMTPAIAQEEEGDFAVMGERASRIERTYRRQKNRVGGLWHSYITMVDGEGGMRPVVEDDADAVTNGYSVQKLAVATAVMDKIDRGEAALDQRLELTADIILGGSGIYHLQTAYGDQLTVANFLTAMLLVSDNTAVRLSGLVVPALEINEILAAKGFEHTRVGPVSNPNRFFLGTTTPREMNDLLTRLADKTLLSESSCDFLLGIIRWVNGYHDGVRRNMSSNERSRVGTKYGAEFNDLGASRHEAGVMFGTDGSPVLVYGLFADGLGDLDNYGATHPAVEAHAVLGRTMFDAIGTLTNPGTLAEHTVPDYRPGNGG